jgi:hypothetical protein
LGPLVIGTTSDYYAAQAAVTDGVELEKLSDAERLPYRAQGLRGAMYLLPLVNLMLAGTLFAGARTVTADSAKLQRWMQERSDAILREEEREKVVT